MKMINADALTTWIKESQKMTSKVKAILCYIEMPMIWTSIQVYLNVLTAAGCAMIHTAEIRVSVIRSHITIALTVERR